jgi:putative heme-binding domain-containing protein
MPLVNVLATVARDGSAPPEARAAAVSLLGPLHRKLPEWKGEWWAYHPALSAPPRKTVEWEGTPVVLAALRETLGDADEGVVLAALEAFYEAGDPAAAAPIRRIVSRSGPAARRAALRALATCDDGNSVTFLCEQLKPAPGDESLKPQVLETLGLLKAAGAVTVIKDKAASTPAVRRASLDALVRIGGDKACAAIVELMGHERPDVRREAVRAAGELGDRTLVPKLLKAYAGRDTHDAAIDALARLPDGRAVAAYLEGLGSPDFARREKCRQALRDVRDVALLAVEEAVGKGLSDERVLELQQLYADHAKAKQGPMFRVQVSRKHPGEYAEFAVNNTGDVQKGQKVFGATQTGGLGCVVCHAVNGAGGSVGPDLSGVGAKYSRRDLAEAVVYPSKAVREGYQQVIVRTKNGQTYAGPLKSETADGLTLHEADGTLRTVRKADVAQRKDSGLSPMPENLHAGLTPQQFADLVSYLESLKTDQPPPAGKETP